jgi:hypothetical protein
MRRTDHILSLTSSLLSATEKKFSPIFSILEEIYAINEIKKINYISIGVKEDEREEPLASWVRRLREEKALNINCFYINFNDQSLSAHIAAAFAGSSDLLIEITTAKNTRSYLLKTFFSPQYEITPEQFIVLLNSQTNKEIAWTRAATLILDSNALNNRKIFDPAEAPDYLSTDEGRTVFGYLVTDLIKEMQIELALHEQEFIIPETLESLFVKQDAHFSIIDNLGLFSLYPLGDVTAQEILSLVEAQPFKDLTWEKLNTILEMYADPEMPPVAVTEWKDKIMKMDVQQLKEFVHPICGSICRLCEENDTSPVIPQELADRFGPDEAEQKRISARFKANNNSKNLEVTRQPWEYYQFTQIENIQHAQQPSVSDTQKILMEALEDIRAFAAVIQSPYEEAFRLSLFILTTPLPAGLYNEEHVHLLTEKLQAAGFSERAAENFRHASWMGGFFKSLQWNDTRIQNMLAISIADVFGGMGSWNDQYVEQDQDRYHTVSAALFEALRKHLASLLSA